MLALYSRNMLCIILEYSLSRIFATVVPVRSNSDLGGSVRTDRAEDRQADLPMQILIGRGDVAGALAASAVLAEIEEVEIRLEADHVRIGHAVLVPASVGTRLEHGIGQFAPGMSIHGAGQSDAGPLPGAGLIPIPELVFIPERGAVGGDVRAFPGPRIRGEDHTLLLPVSTVVGGGEAGAPGAAVEAGVQKQGPGARDY